MLLAAGRGERMEPLSTVVPKPGLDVTGRPLLSSALDHLETAGCDPVVVNLHRHPLQIRAAARAVRKDVRFSFEPELLGSGGGIAEARPLFVPGPVLTANADIWANLDLAPLLAAGAPNLAVLALVKHPDPGRWSSVEIDAAGHVTAIRPKGAAGGFLFSGFQLLGAKVVAELPHPPFETGVVWNTLIGERRLFGVVVSGGWQEVSTPAAYRRLVVGLLNGGSWVHGTATVAESATLVSSAVGRHSKVGALSTVEESVLTAEAMVAEGAVVRRSVVAGAMIERDQMIEDSIVVPGAVHSIPQGETGER